MSENEYKIGDVVNGHRLGEDNQWHPVQGQPPHNPKADARAAKAYYKASRPWYKKKRILIPLVLVVLIGIGAATGGGGGDTPDNEASSATSDTSSDTSGTDAEAEQPDAEAEAPKPKAKPNPKAMRVKAGAILKEFEGNEAVADQKYKGKTLIVTGSASKVDTEFLDENQYIVMVDDGGEYSFLSVNCNDVSTAQALKVQPDAPITVRGEFDDGGDLGVELKDCEVV